MVQSSHSPTHLGASSSSQPSSSHNLDDEQATLQSIQGEQASLQAYVPTKHVVLRDFVQERHDELHGTIISKTQYFQPYRVS